MLKTDFIKLYEELSTLNEELTILTEGTKYDKKAISKLAASGLFSEEASANIVNALFREDIHAFVHAPSWLEKYLIGIVNMLIKHCNGDVSKAEQFLTETPGTFEEYLTWVKEARPNLPAEKQAELDKEFNEEMSYEDLVAKLDELRAQREAESSERLKNMKFEGESSYELIPIDSFEQFNKLFGGAATGDGYSDKFAGNGGTAWCHANSASVYDSWIKSKNKFFVLANKDWKNIHFSAESNAANPKDTYGNSLIAILVSTKTGSLLKATLRCNHVGVKNNADNQYQTYAKLSNLVGFNVEDRIKEYLQDSLVDLTGDQNIFDGSRESLELYCETVGTTTCELETIVIPNTVTTIGESAFENCTGLTSITIPNSVTTIGDFAFSGCTGLTNITIPNSVTTIGDSAFNGCTGLTSVTIPDSVTTIEWYAFSGCTGLTSITIPNSVTSIGGNAFYGCTGLTSVTFAESSQCASIGDYAFQYCSKLTSVTIPSSVTSIGSSAFFGCSGLVSVTIPSGVIFIRDYAFYDCSGLTSVTIPSSVTSIGTCAFSNCTGLTSITIPDSVTYIGEYAFSVCFRLTIITNPGSYAEQFAKRNNIPVKHI